MTSRKAAPSRSAALPVLRAQPHAYRSTLQAIYPVDPPHTSGRECSGASARLDAAALARVATSAEAVARIVAGGETVYGINTGFGLLAQTRIPSGRLSELQRNLILSHSCGLGDATPAPRRPADDRAQVARARRGHSGVRATVIDGLQALLDRDAMPLIPSQGSVGASGDLAPLAHMTAALIGQGWIDLAGERLPAGAALRAVGLDAARAWPQGGPRADQRHPGIDRDRARCPVHGRAGVRRRARTPARCRSMR